MCGGKSKRMGTDKGLIPIGNTCWAAYMADKLVAIPMPVVISVNTSQIETYQAFFSIEQLVVDSLNIGGPLNGLLGVHLKYPDDDLLLVACDMVNMKAKTLDRLISTYLVETGYDCYVYQNIDFAEPFCGIYKASVLSDLMNRSEVVTLSNMSLQKLLNDRNTLRLSITEWESFQNYNTLT